MSTAKFRQSFNSLITSNNSKQVSASRLRTVLESSADAIDENFKTVTIADGLGTFNAATGVATIKETGETLTLSAVSTFANGKYFDVVVPGTRTITGESVDMEIGGIVISRGTTYDYIPKSSLALQNLNGVVVDQQGKTPGLYVPESQYLHVRGDAEILGNASYFNAASYGIYEQMTSAVVFNTIRIPFSVISPTTVTIRVYKSASVSTNPNSMTLLSEKVIASGSFNTNELVVTEVTMPDFIRANSGDYIYIFAQASAVNLLKIKRWSAQSGTSPLRHSFIYTTNTSTPWNTVYDTSSLPSFCGPTFELRLVNESTITKGLYDKVNSDLLGIKVDQTNGKSTGVYIPSVPYEHSRGESEILGNGFYTSADSFGFGWYDSVSALTNFNRVEIGIKALSAQPITVKIGKYGSVTSAIQNITILETVDFPAGTFNSSDTKAVISLLNHYVILPGEYIYVLVFCSTGSVLQGQRFTADTTAPARHAFLRKTTSVNPWTTSWEFSVTGSGYWQTGIRLYNVESDPILLSRMIGNEGKIASNTASIESLRLRSTISYEHPRGASEMAGTANYATMSETGYGMVEQMSQDTYFSKVEIPMYVRKSIGDITVKVMTFTSISGVVSGFTELFSQVYASQSWNTIPTVTQSIVLPAPVKVSSGTYLYVLVSGSAAAMLGMRYFGVDATSPSRRRFLTTNSLTPFSATWNFSSGSFYSASYRLSLADPSAEKRLTALEWSASPRLTVPSKINACVGVELSIYYDAILYGKDNGLNGNSNYSVEIVCAKGNRRERYWRITPISGDVGTYTMTFYVYDSQNRLVLTKACSLTIVGASNPAIQKQLLHVGDSITDNDNSRIAMNERKAALSGGVPFVFVGSRGSGTTKHEGHPGWKWVDFTNDGASAPAPAGNPFWNSGTAALDITNYRTVVLGLTENFHGISIQLGVNDCRTTQLSETTLLSSIGYAKTLVNAFLADSPAAKIIVQIPTVDINVMYDTYYRKSDYRYNIWRLREMIIETFDNGAFHANVSVGQAGITLDRYFGYPYASIVASSRYSETEIVHSDDVHPRTEGYKQMGDGMFPQILAILQ